MGQGGIFSPLWDLFRIATVSIPNGRVGFTACVALSRGRVGEERRKWTWNAEESDGNCASIDTHLIPMDNDKIGKTDNCFQKMDQLDKLSLKELIDLNAAVQSEITRRLLNLGEENRRCRSRLVDDDVRSEEGFDDDSRESRRFRLQRSSDKAEQEFGVDKHGKTQGYRSFGERL